MEARLDQQDCLDNHPVHAQGTLTPESHSDSAICSVAVSDKRNQHDDSNSGTDFPSLL